MKQLLLSAILLSAVCLVAQNSEFKTMRLDSTKKLIKLTEKEKNDFPAMTVKEYVTVEYIAEGEEIAMYQTVHKKSVVINDKGVEYFNKVYIPASKILDIVDIKARSVSPSGKETYFDKTAVKEIDNLEDKGAYKIFALEGIEKGSTVEMLYTVKFNVTSNGKYTFQEDFPVRDATFSLVTPENLVFGIKAYHGAFTKTDTVIEKKHYITFHCDSLPPMRVEKYAAYSANLARVEFSFSNNTSVSKTPSNTWASAAKSLYDAYYSSDEKSDKAILKLLKGLKLDTMSETNKIRTIENYIKDNFELKEVRGIKDIATLAFALKNKYTNEEGLTSLFCRFYSLAGINHQLGCTSNRYNYKFDKDFMTWQYLYEYVIYFPNIDRYLSPTATPFRLGVIPEAVTNNDALFLKIIKIGDFTSALPEIKTIPNNPMNENFTNQYATIDFDNSKTLCKIHYRHELAGYEANYIRPFYDFLPEDKIKESCESILKIMNADTKVLNYKVENTGHNESPIDKPFVLEGDLEVPNLIERAGDNIIFKVGDVIGPQEEMYDNHKRDNPIELEFSHSYYRLIKVNIPDGYVVKGLDNLVMKKECSDGAAGFESSYSIEGKVLKVTVKEYYRDINLPIEKYEAFRTVINASADFNKIAVVFEKK